MHKILLLSHLDCLGLRVNFAKSTLSPSQRVLFLGTVIDSMQMTTTVSAEQATTIQRHTASLKEGAARPLKENAGPYGSGFAGTSVGSASHATHPVLAERPPPLPIGCCTAWVAPVRGGGGGNKCQTLFPCVLCFRAHIWFSCHH